MSNHIINTYHTLLCYTVWSLILLTNYVTLEVVLDSNPVFINLYEILASRILVLTGRSVAPTIHNLIIAILALVLLELQSTAWDILVWVMQCLGIISSHEHPTQQLIDPSPPNPNIIRLLGDEGFIEVRRRILQAIGQYPPLDSFPILDAPSLRPYNRFTDPALFDRELLGLVRPTYRKIMGRRDRTIGSTNFFVKVDQLLLDMDKRNSTTPLPISFQRHPRMIHTHPSIIHRDNFPKMSEVVFQYESVIKAMSPVINSLHREFRVLIIYLLYLLGCLEQAAACDDLVFCIESLELVDNVTTSLRGLCEVSYAVREKARKTTSI